VDEARAMIRDVQKAIDRALGSIRRPFRALQTAIRLGTMIQLVQADALAGEQLQDAELFQHYGFTSAPLDGTQLIVLPLGGRTAHGIIIATEHGTYRLKLAAKGEVALYSDEGDHVYLKRGRVMEIVTNTLLINAATKVRMETPLVETTGEIKADLDITDRMATVPSSMFGMRETYNGHTHNDPQGGAVSAPNEQM
jgi:phage baseplate assembly protein V